MPYQYTSTAIDEQTVLRTYSHEELNIPFKVMVKRVPKQDPQIGDWFNFVVKELNLDVEKTISQAQLHHALMNFGDDIGELSIQLFVGQDGFITSKEQFEKVVSFSNANQEYKQWQIGRNGLTVDQVEEDNWIDFLLSDFCFFMAETLVQIYEGTLN